MSAPAPGATAPPRKADPTTSSTAAGAAKVPATTTLFTVTSPGFEPGGEIPPTSTCDGIGTAPPFSWVNVPPGTAELVLTVTDPDAANYVHWFVAGIDPASKGMVPGALPAGAVELANSAGTAAYAPICPPPGETHSYDISLFALSAPSGLTAASATKDAMATVASTATGTAVLTGSYTRASAN
jgi:Raf kinase inhibitor-like YbhB/YbcL family protein